MVYSERTAQKLPDKKVMKKTPRTPRKSTRRNGLDHQVDFKKEGARQLSLRDISDILPGTNERWTPPPYEEDKKAKGSLFHM